MDGVNSFKKQLEQLEQLEPFEPFKPLERLSALPHFPASLLPCFCPFALIIIH